MSDIDEPNGGEDEAQFEEEYDYQYDDSEGDDEDEQEAPGEQTEHKAPVKPRSRSASLANIVDDKIQILEEAQLRAQLGEAVDAIRGVMNIPPAAAITLLRHYQWNRERALEKYYEDSEAVMVQLGIKNVAQASLVPKVKTLCQICADMVEGENLYGLPCGHFFCRDCWREYLQNKVEDGPVCVYTSCPAHKCQQIAPEELFEEFLSPELVKKYQKYALQSYVDVNKRLRFCPGKSCEKIIRAPIACPHVKCHCGEVFCFKCGEESHEPASCKELTMWLEKCQNESETANWILAHTKRCPKCNTRIEKNQGCNHMTCRQCKYEFCWMCMGPWTEHGSGTGGYYKCNRFESGDISQEASDAAKAKAELDRYLHYYQRYQSHEASQKFAQKQFEQVTESRMTELQEAQNATWIDVQFLKLAAEQLIECRRTLKYTYVFGFYFELGPAKKQLFEHHQEYLEKFTEHLSELSELPLDKMDRTEIINYTRVTHKYLQSLLQSVADGLEESV